MKKHRCKFRVDKITYSQPYTYLKNFINNSCSQSALNEIAYVVDRKVYIDENSYRLFLDSWNIFDRVWYLETS